ncbi:hypothetical protein BHE74_00013782 [Ensete ventricosum]|nr:hypothetical protein GW17_00009762 [Ensete ventricosum]RWW78017.1 hypothetical protein BHE74_00013782 [Ensete ventricosum]
MIPSLATAEDHHRGSRGRSKKWRSSRESYKEEAQVCGMASNNEDLVGSLPDRRGPMPIWPKGWRRSSDSMARREGEGSTAEGKGGAGEAVEGRAVAPSSRPLKHCWREMVVT